MSHKDAAQAAELVAESREQFLAMPPLVARDRMFQIGANLNESARAQIAGATPEGMGDEGKLLRTVPKQSLLDVFQATGSVLQKGDYWGSTSVGLLAV